VLACIIQRGDRMQQTRMAAAEELRDAQRDDVRGLAGISPATELQELAAQRRAGTITEDEVLSLKTRILAG